MDKASEPKRAEGVICIKRKRRFLVREIVFFVLSVFVHRVFRLVCDFTLPGDRIHVRACATGQSGRTDRRVVRPTPMRSEAR